jgi:hypothetical protein
MFLFIDVFEEMILFRNNKCWKKYFSLGSHKKTLQVYDCKFYYVFEHQSDQVPNYLFEIP